MTKTTPSYLRIHRAPARIQQTAGREIKTADTTDQLWRAFSDATGWRLQRFQETQPRELVLLPTLDFDPIADADQVESIPMVTRSSASRLAVAASSLITELDEAHAALRRQDAELASRAVLIGDQQRESIANRLEQTLQRAAAACRCDSAAMYLLDDDTQTLKARAVFDLPPNRIQQPPRMLRGSRGDLEALVQGVICINDLSETEVDTWHCPEQAGSAICAPISDDSVPIGTLWMFSDQVNQFTAADRAAAQLASTQLAQQLKLARSTCEANTKHQSSQAIRDVTQWQFMGLPMGTHLADGWLVDGMIESPRDWAIGWHAWDVLPDGTLMMAMAESDDESLTGAMAAATCRAALTAHTGYRHTPRELMQRVSDTLWQTNTGEQLISLLYARIDPETGEGEVAAAGKITAIISSSYGYRPLMDGKTPMLTSHIDSQSEIASFRLSAGEAFLAYGPGLGDDGQSQQLLGDRLRTSLQGRDAHPLAAIRRSLASIPLEQERGAITILRQ